MKRSKLIRLAVAAALVVGSFVVWHLTVSDQSGTTFQEVELQEVPFETVP